MKYFLYAVIGLLLLCAIQAPVSAQSGRKSTIKVVVPPPPPPPSPPAPVPGKTTTGDRFPLCEVRDLTVKLPGKTEEEKVFTRREVDQSARIIQRPAPQYTRSARRNEVSGRVTLRIILASNGQIMGVTVIKGLPHGLTEEAIKAARRITFEPATKNGQAVSQYVCVDYNFQTY